MRDLLLFLAKTTLYSQRLQSAICCSWNKTICTSVLLLKRDETRGPAPRHTSASPPAKSPVFAVCSSCFTRLWIWRAIGLGISRQVVLWRNICFLKIFVLILQEISFSSLSHLLYRLTKSNETLHPPLRQLQLRRAKLLSFTRVVRRNIKSE